MAAITKGRFVCAKRQTGSLNLRMGGGRGRQGEVSRGWKGLEGATEHLADGTLVAGFSEIRSKVNRSVSSKP